MNNCSCSTCSTQMHKQTNDKLEVWSGLEGSGKTFILKLLMKKIGVVHILFTSPGVSSYSVEQRNLNDVYLVILMRDKYSTLDYIMQTYQKTAERNIKYIFLTEEPISEQHRQKYRDIMEVIDFRPLSQHI